MAAARLARHLGAPDWHRRMWALAAPIMLSNVSVPLLGAVDTAVVGHLPDPAYLGAVAVGALIFNFLFWGFGFLRLSTTGLAAQAHGGGRADELRAVLGRAALLALAIGVGLILLRGPIAWGAFAVIGTSDAVRGHAETYVDIRIWAAPATLATYALLGWLLGIGRARLVLLIQLVLNGSNIVLDLVFVVGLGWEVAGVAWASVIAEYLALAVGLAVMARLLPGLGGAWRRSLLTDLAAFRRLMGVNRDLFLRTLCLIAGFAWFTAQGAQMGDTVLAANAVLLNFQSFLAYALDGYAHAAEALVGHAIGARDGDGFDQVVRVTGLWALLTAGGFALLYGLAGPLLIAVLTGIAEVRATALAYLPWTVAMPLVAVWSYQLDGIFIGALRTAAMRNAMALSLAALLAAGWLLVPLAGNHGLWAAFTLFMVARAVTLGLAFPALRRGVG